MSGKNFIPFENIVSGILFEIGDEHHRQYYTRAWQWALDEYRRLTVHHSSFYLERRLDVDKKTYTAPYPDGMVELLSVGIYLDGEFFPFTRKPNLSGYPTDADDGIYESDGSEMVDIPDQGFLFGARGSNIGYFREDPENCRILVRNYRWSTTNQSHTENTDQVAGKIIARFKTDGLSINEDMCVPYEFRELIIALVYSRFMEKNIPVQKTNFDKQAQRERIEALADEFYEHQVGIKSLMEVKDALFASQNNTARR